VSGLTLGQRAALAIVKHGNPWRTAAEMRIRRRTMEQLEQLGYAAREKVGDTEYWRATEIAEDQSCSC
jgi:hypothetical protein